MSPVQAYVLSNKYTDASFDGYGQTIKGISPTVTVTKSDGVNDIDFKYVGASGQEYHEHAYVSDGETGPIGPVGETGATGAPGQDGKDGKDGKDGVSPSANVEAVQGGVKITVTDSTATTTAVVENGAQGPEGPQGPQGPQGEKGDKGDPGSGGGGTSDYNDLENLPTINGKEIKNEVAEDIAAIVEPLTNSDVTDIENIIDDDANI